jgi:hypothetical protein
VIKCAMHRTSEADEALSEIDRAAEIAARLTGYCECCYCYRQRPREQVLATGDGRWLCTDGAQCGSARRTSPLRVDVGL